jgi:Protein of unknown function (DUF2452)
MTYNAKLSIKLNIGQTYQLYEKKDSDHMLSLISPKEWGRRSIQKIYSCVKLPADHTWMEL